MRHLKVLLDKRGIMPNFHPLKNRVRCYAHTINICSSHIIASMTPTSSSYLSALKVPFDPTSYAIRDDSNDGNGTDSDSNESDGPDPVDAVDDLELAGSFDGPGDSRAERWSTG